MSGEPARATGPARVEIAGEPERLEAWTAALGAEPETVATAAAGVALEVAGVDPAAADIGLLLTDDAEMAALNTRFRGVAAPTDVLSWPSRARARPFDPDDATDAAEGFLGDVALGLQTVRNGASERGAPFPDHVRHLIVHGVLHLLGYDHETDEDAARMEGREAAALARLGVADPYADRAEAPAGGPEDR